jgi:hypothetical protein
MFVVSISLFTVSAIANYTARVVDTTLSATQRQEALKFLGTSMRLDPILPRIIIQYVVYADHVRCAFLPRLSPDI